MTLSHSNIGPEVPMEVSGAVREYRFVKVSGDNTIAECDAEEQAIGVSTEAASASGDVIEVQITGIARVEAGGSISAGAYVNSDADGKAVAEATDAKVASGIALKAADSGDIISIKIVDMDLSV